MSSNVSIYTTALYKEKIQVVISHRMIEQSRVCVWSRERVVQQASIALSAGDFQLMFMRNSIKLLGSFRMVVGKPAGLRHLLRRRRR